MKCHAGIELPKNGPCPKCGARLGEVCWPGINHDLFALNELRKLARAAVEEFPVASGLYVDMDGRDGYGSLRALRLFLEKSAPGFKAPHNSGERDPSVMPDCLGADAILSQKSGDAT